jgi:RimJ/RimL family protein N-acetyltransferase
MTETLGRDHSAEELLPEILTRRLILRAFRMEDAPRVRALAGEREIAANTANIPHPYEEGLAEAWIGSQAERRSRGQAVVFAFQLRGDLDAAADDTLRPGDLVGAVGLELDPQNRQAELGYWIGKPYWGRGLATEAARAVLRHGFEELSLNRIHAHHFAHNASSGRVLEKIGMVREGCRREHVRKWGRFVDVVLYGVLADEYGSAEPAVGR